MFDVVVTGGTLIDGTGAPRREADVAIRDGRVVEIAAPGRASEGAARTIDVGGLVVAPGFIDLHTHYDAQLFWDPTASPSPLHGVTTVFGGNCGFTLAPGGDEHMDYLSRLMARVEGIPLPALQQGVPWGWKTFADFLDGLDGNIAVNAGFLVGHSALRRVVMGDAAVQDTASEAHLVAMAALLDDAIEAGALGLSSSQSHTHNDGDGNPVPSRAANREELVRLAGVLAAHDGTQLEWIVAGCINGFSAEETELLSDLSVAARSPLNWNVLAAGDVERDAHQLAPSTYAAERGGEVVALTLPNTMEMRLSFLTGFVLDGLPGWREILHRPVPDRIQALRDPVVRAEMLRQSQSPEAGMLARLAQWQYLIVAETFAPENRAYEGKTVGQIATEQGKEPFDALLDVVIADGLRTGVQPKFPKVTDEVWAERAAVWKDPRAIIGGSDAGAHLDMMSMSTYSTFVVGEATRDLGLLDLETAVNLLTDRPARLYGLVDRGRVEVGAHADLVAFDPDTVAPRSARTLDDLPGGASRLLAGAVGIEHVLVNGVEIAAAGDFTGDTPGALLRSGRDTVGALAAN